MVWLLPRSQWKTKLLNLLGNRIACDVTVGPNLVIGCGPFVIGEGVAFGSLNAFRNMAEVRIGAGSFLGNLNSVSAHPDYQHQTDWAGRLILAPQSGITSRHYLDCSGEIRIGRMGMVAGVKSVLQSHELNLRRNEATIGRISIGEYAFTASRVVIVKDAHVPARSVLSAGSVMLRGDTRGQEGVFGGNPARFVKEFTDAKWMTRSELNTPVGFSTDGRAPDMAGAVD